MGGESLDRGPEKGQENLGCDVAFSLRALGSHRGL